ncbi:ribosome maturation factor RimP [Corynebacterium sp. 13CS0277]|uniref:ribosome maturation factor RimP n=1 Tax=Corynebacterium sp. 13CS0277 TaxID=2071994 RepID=UPI000D02CA33|nr:ribosome maturation factor RimP [Corynebacterium sp. 13CS0277]PRQ12613.1 ribosome maturation factor RimP [Corynebacterium sp. 13CS0277]
MAFPTVDILAEYIAPVAEKYHVDVEKITAHRAGAKSAVVVAVDSDTHPDLDQLEVISQELGEVFDAAEERGELNFGAGYTLEVTTPGVAHPLSLPRHWRRNRGRLVTVTREGAPELQGRIGPMNEAEDTVALIVRDGKKLSVVPVEFSTVGQAVVEIEFSQPPAEETDLAGATFDDCIAQRKD